MVLGFRAEGSSLGKMVAGFIRRAHFFCGATTDSINCRVYTKNLQESRLR